MSEPTKSKKCKKCNEIKSLDLFPVSHMMLDRRESQCKSCKAAHVRAYAKKKKSERYDPFF